MAQETEQLSQRRELPDRVHDAEEGLANRKGSTLPMSPAVLVAADLYFKLNHRDTSIASSLITNKAYCVLHARQKRS